MSIDYTTYLGPHIRCKTNNVPSTETIITCSNTACTMYSIKLYGKQKKFCEECGSLVKERPVENKIQNVNANDVQVNLLNETLFNVPGDSFHFWMRDNNVHIWLANRRTSETRDFSFDYSEQDIQYVPMTAELIVKEIEQFSSFYEKEIVLLQQEYGEENVDVQWGLIHYIY